MKYLQQQQLQHKMISD